jgi:F0F1-type ATP synthase alpha subunit
MSITDGQWILDMKVFREGIRPALNTGLSVTRVGTRGYNERQKEQNSQLLKAQAAYTQAQEFSHFGAELSAAAKADITRGTWLKTIYTQVPGETYSLLAQQLIMDVVLNISTDQNLDVAVLKRQAIALAKNIKSDDDFKAVSEQLKKQSVTGSAPAAAPAAPAPAAVPAANPAGAAK